MSSIKTDPTKRTLLGTFKAMCHTVSVYEDPELTEKEEARGMWCHDDWAIYMVPRSEMTSIDEWWEVFYHELAHVVETLTDKDMPHWFVHILGAVFSQAVGTMNFDPPPKWTKQMHETAFLTRYDLNRETLSEKTKARDGVAI